MTANCRCQAFPGPCDAAVTQEDLLCDNCRAVKKLDGRARCLALISGESFFHQGYTAGGPEIHRPWRPLGGS